MARAENTELIDAFEEFYRNYYRNEIGELAQQYPTERKSLHVHWEDLYRFDPDLADDYRAHPEEFQDYAEEALRLYDLPVDVKLGQAHVRVCDLPEHTDIREIRADHRGNLISVQGIVRKATDVRPKITQAAFECQRCGTLTRIPQQTGEFQEPHECQGCERQGPFRINFDQSEFVDAQKIRVQESPEGLRGGETPQAIDVNIEDDITGEVTAGDHVTVTGVLKLDQQGNDREKSAMFDVYMDGVDVSIEDEQFEEMDITEQDKRKIIALSEEADLYEKMVGAIAPSIYGYDQEKLAIILQLFSGVTKHLPDESRIRGDLHMLLIGDPGTGKCVDGETLVTLADGSRKPIGDLVEGNLDDPKPVDDGVWDSVDFEVPSLREDGSIGSQQATKVWKREAPDWMYRIRTAAGREISVTPSHPLFVRSGDGFEPVRAERLHVGQRIVSHSTARSTRDESFALADGGQAVATTDRIETITPVEPDDEWVYDLEVTGTHNYLSNGVVSHNSQLLSYIRNIAPRSVYTSGKGSSSAGLCVTGDTLVQTEEGIREIRDIVTPELPDSVDAETSVEKSVRVQTFDRGTGEVRGADSSHVWRMPEKSCHRIETKHGKELEASVDTPVLTCGDDGMEWCEITEVEAGDYVAVPRFDDLDRAEARVRSFLELTTEKIRLSEESVAFLRESLQEEYGTLRDAAAELDLSEEFIYLHLKNRHVPVEKLDWMLDGIGASREDVDFDRLMLRHGDSFTVPDVFDEDLMYLLGLVFGDGDIALDRRGGNRGLVRISNSDEELLERAADIFAEKFDKQPEIEHQDDRIPCIRVSSATIARLFSNAGMESPKDDLSLDPALTVAAHADAFLRGLMDADGCVSVRESGGSSVLMSTISTELAKQIQLMLETYGVRAKIRERDRRGTYELADGYTIESKHVQQFVEMYGADIDRYAEAIGFGVTEKQEALDAVVKDTRRQREKVPVGSALAPVDGVVGEYYTNVNRGDNPGRQRARARLEDIDLGPVESLVREAVDADLRWDEVVASVETGEKEVFDLTVPDTHNFIGNGIVTHNTAAAVRDDFGEGQQWTLEAGALVLADQGIAAVDELDKMAPDDRSAMHQALEQQSYHPSSEIFLSNGRKVEISEFVDERMAENPDEVTDGVDCEILPVDDVGVHSVDLETNDVTKTSVDRVSRHEAPEEFVRVTFSNGRDVLVTPEHPMFVEDDGEVGTVEARDIEEGAFVPAPRKLPNSAQPVALDDEAHVGKEKNVDLPDELTPELGEILGFLTAEGHSYVGSTHHIGFSNQDERLLDRMDRLMTDVFGMSSSDHTNDAGTVTKCWVSTKLYRWFESNFPAVMHTARDKRMPAAVLGASEEVIRRFLVGAFAGDGGVESEAMCISTASEGLAEDYADALAKIGVASRIHYNSTEDSWKTYVMGDSTERFVEQVVEPADERYEKARTFAQRSADTPRHHDVLPSSIARELRELRRLLGLRLTGQFRPNLDEGYGVQVETVERELAELRERVDEVRTDLDAAETLRDVRTAAGWSGSQLAERLDGETTSAVHYAENGGYDETRRTALADRAHDAIERALVEFGRRASALEDRCDLRYYRVTDVETVPNEGDHACDWAYDVTVEPTNTFVSQGVVLHNSISINKAGINATLKSRCSLLGAANPKYGRFDQYEPISEQIDLEPALISRFDLIFTVTDQPDEEEDRDLAEHILTTNYAGELHTHRTEVNTSNYSPEEVENVTEEVEPTIDPDLLRKYVAYAKRNCFPTMTEEAREAIQDFYVDLRLEGADEDAPVPVTARKLEALVRLAEASARVRLSDRVTEADADRVIRIVRDQMEDIGVDPETGEFDADVVEAGTSKSQRDRIKNLKHLIDDLEEEYDEGAPVDVVVERAEEAGMETSKAEHEIEKLKQKGEVYEPSTDHLRTT
ncbi:MAG: LAGLIDADG family homing endonuclease [Haloarculaceae archaeon]